MVIKPNAVVHPRAMVIEPLHTLVANVAVSRVGSADYFASWTEHVWIEFLDKLKERYF